MEGFYNFGMEYDVGNLGYWFGLKGGYFFVLFVDSG